MSDDQNKVMVTVQMPEQLRDDAKDETERGELSVAVRNLYRCIAYGEDADFEDGPELPIPDAETARSVSSTKLTREQAAEIKRRSLEGEANTEIAEDYEIGPDTVSKIKRGERWGDVDADE